MRVISNLFPDINADLQQSQSALNAALQQVSTGKSVNVPSDNPAASAEMVQNILETGNVDQYEQNINSVVTTVQTAGSVLSSVSTSLSQAIALGTEGANGTNSSSDLQALAAQVQSILSGVVSQANTSVSGSYLFGGTNSASQPYVADPTSPTGYSYKGNGDTNSVAVGDQQNIQVNLPGSELFSNASNNVIGSLSSLVSALQSGNSASIASSTASVSAAANYLATQQSFYSNAQARMNSQDHYLQQETVTLASQQNTLVGVNEAQAATELTQAEVDNSAAMAAAGRVLPNTLLNFLGPPQ